jgi:hypothetical protein
VAAVTRGRLWIVAVSIVAFACRDVQPGLTPAEEILVEQYLTCIDCIAPLDTVRALAGRKVDATVDSLNSGLLYGPGARAVEKADSVLVLGYVRDSLWRWQKGLPPLPDRLTYVSEARERYVNGYRARGAIGMGWIHSPRAVALLDSAANLQLPPSVKRAVLYARDSLPPR